MKVSIIVPVYNCEEYLRKCLLSLETQTYKDIEVILIDDGSTDDSGAICDEFVNRDKRFKVIHKRNEGVCIARNMGIDLASGDFIGFVDSDDYCKEEMFQYLVALSQKNDADIACCGIERVYVNTGATFFTRELIHDVVYTTEEALEKYFLPDHITTAVWNKIFKASVAKAVKFKDYARNDDGWFVSHAISSSKKVAVGGECLYIYQIREKSITRGNFSRKNYDILRSVNESYKDARKLFPHNNKMIMAKIFWYVVFLDEMILAGKRNTRVIRGVKALIRKNLITVFEYEDIRFWRKFQFYILALSFNLYSVTYYLYCKLWGKIT